jgi:hypothetical protein
MATTFDIVPPSGSWGYWLVIVPALLALALGVILMLASVSGAHNATFEVSSDGLTLRGDVYGRRIAREKLRLDGVRVVDLDRDAALQPVRRTLGTGLPGYRAGWFRLADGQKALLYVTQASRVVYVPTTDGYSVLLSPKDPHGLAERLRALALPPVSGQAGS